MNLFCDFCMAEVNTGNTICPMCGNRIDYKAPSHHLISGTILNKKYYVGAAIGEGGFGITYIGRDIYLGIKVAIKEFYPNGYANRNNTVSQIINESATEGRKEFYKKGRTDFLKEAQVLAQYSEEPGIVNVRDFFEENNTAYIVMEFLEGITLKEYIKKYGVLSVDSTIKMLLPVMNSLRVIHRNGLIHRDISPDNIMICADRVKLLDFGAARNVLTVENKSFSIMLKQGYAPEEQYRSKGVQGSWTDVYALCATIYKCITGITPDEANQRLTLDEVKAPSQLGVKISPEVENTLMMGLAVRRENRIQTINELLDGFQGNFYGKKNDAKFDPDKTVVIGDNEIIDEYKKRFENDSTEGGTSFHGEQYCDDNSGDNSQKNPYKTELRSFLKNPKYKNLRIVIILFIIVIILAIVLGVGIRLKRLARGDNSSGEVLDDPYTGYSQEITAASSKETSTELSTQPSTVPSTKTPPPQDNPTDSGPIGSKSTWKFYKESGKLVISGKGEMGQVVSSDTDEMHGYWEKYVNQITTVVLEEGLTSFSYSAFEYHNKLSNVYLPNSLQVISTYALWGDTALKQIKIPKNVNWIGELCFFETGLKEVIVDNENEYYTSVDGVLYSKDKTELVYYPSYKTNEAYTIPDTVKFVNEGAFRLNSEGETFLRSLTLPTSLEYDGGFLDLLAFCSWENEVYYKGSYDQWAELLGDDEDAWSYNEDINLICMQ